MYKDMSNDKMEDKFLKRMFWTRDTCDLATSSYTPPSDEGLIGWCCTCRDVGMRK